MKKKHSLHYSLSFKEAAIQRVIDNHESLREVSISLGLTSHGMLGNWIHSYKQNGYNVIVKKRGRKSMHNNQPSKPKKQETEEERLQKEIQYLKAENEYLKKLRAVVQSRKNRQSKKE